jgi:hypothetical protein
MDITTFRPAVYAAHPPSLLPLSWPILGPVGRRPRGKLLNNSGEIGTARQKRKWRAVAKSETVKRFPAIPPTARQFEKWQPVPWRPRKTRVFENSTLLWRAVVGRTELNSVLRTAGLVAKPAPRWPGRPRPRERNPLCPMIFTVSPRGLLGHFLSWVVHRRTSSWIAPFRPLQPWIFPNPMEGKRLIDCIAPVHTHSPARHSDCPTPWPKIVILRKCRLLAKRSEGGGQSGVASNS